MPLIPTDIELAKAAKRRRRNGKPVKASAREERKLRQAMSSLWKDILLPATDRIKQLVKQNAAPSIIAREIESALLTAQMTYGRQVDNIIDRWTLGVDREVQNALHKTMQDALGIDVTAMLNQPEIRNMLEVSSIQSAMLIKTIPGEYLGKVAQAVNDNLNGRDLPEGRTLVAQIQHLGGVSYRRSRLIARDQTTKLTAALNSHRQQACGIEMYVWRGVKDKREVGNPAGFSPIGNKAHGDHFHLEGVYCRWDDPTICSLDQGRTWKKRPAGWSQRHPGEDIQCRCWASPVIDPQKIIALAKAA